MTKSWFSLVGKLKFLLLFLFLFACESQRDESFRAHPSYERSISCLKENLSGYLLAGDSDGLMKYINSPRIPHVVAQQTRDLVSFVHANNVLENYRVGVLDWSPNHDEYNLPGRFDGKELRFTDDPEGVIFIDSENAELNIEITLFMAYFEEGGKYMLCGMEVVDEQ